MSTITKLKKNKSKKYNANLAKINEVLNGADSLPLQEAVKTLFSLEQPNFKEGPMIELHLNLNINASKSDQFVRSSVVLPHGTGKKVRVAAFVTPEKEEEAKKAGAELVGSEELIEEIKKSGKIEFDVAIAQPEMMKKLPSIARLLGTAGVMPNPKTGTVGDNIEEMITLAKAGKVDFKNDKTGNIHIPCGKINSSFTEEKIVENITAAIESVEKAKPEAVKKKLVGAMYLTTSQSPSIKLS